MLKMLLWDLKCHHWKWTEESWWSISWRVNDKSSWSVGDELMRRMKCTSGWMKVTGCPLSLYVWFGISSQSGIVSTYSALIRRFHSFITWDQIKGVNQINCSNSMPIPDLPLNTLSSINLMFTCSEKINLTSPDQGAAIGISPWAGLVYLSEAHVLGQQQDEQRVGARLREEQHEATDCTVGRRRHHQTKAREAWDVDDHMTVHHLIRCNEVQAAISYMSYRQEVLTAI